MTPTLTRRAVGRFAGSLLPAVAFVVTIPGPARAQAAGREQDVTFSSGSVTLAGTLIRPAASGVIPAIVLLHGSGPGPRTLLKSMAQRFVGDGFAALIFDKRGSGASTGSWTEASLNDLASDALAAAAFLRSQPGVDPRRVGAWGVSQAGWVIPRAVASEPTAFAFVVVVTGGGLKPIEVERYDYRAALSRIGVSGDQQHEAIELMAKADGFEILQGHVEIDEAYVGGRRSGGKRGRGAPGKTVVLGMIEREGRTHAQTVPNAKKETLRPIVLDSVKPGSTVNTDELLSYGLLDGDGYRHFTVKHGEKEYVYTDPRGRKHHTNTVESFWRLFKNSVRSTHIHVGAKYMDRYLREFTFRSNHREMQNAMFDLLIAAV